MYLVGDGVLVSASSAVPEDFDFNPQSGKHGDRTHRVELKRASVEYVAPSEYMVRRGVASFPGREGEEKTDSCPSRAWE